MRPAAKLALRRSLQVCAALKEAISALSPIIRARLRGLPAYVLDYSDLIAPNTVEKPFLKPVIIAGPHTGERRRQMERLVKVMQCSCTDGPLWPVGASPFQDVACSRCSARRDQ
jgi:hypothetical protein